MRQNFIRAVLQIFCLLALKCSRTKVISPYYIVNVVTCTIVHVYVCNELAYKKAITDL